MDWLLGVYVGVGWIWMCEYGPVHGLVCACGLVYACELVCVWTAACAAGVGMYTRGSEREWAGMRGISISIRGARDLTHLARIPCTYTQRAQVMTKEPKSRRQWTTARVAGRMWM